MFKAKHIMTTDVVTVDPDDTIDEAVSLLLEHEISGLPVLDTTGSLVGIITEFDCSVAENEDWVRVADILRNHHMRRLPVTRDGKLVGIIARHDLMRTIRDARRRVRKELARNAASSSTGKLLPGQAPEALVPEEPAEGFR